MTLEQYLVDAKRELIRLYGRRVCNYMNTHPAAVEAFKAGATKAFAKGTSAERFALWWPRPAWIEGEKSEASQRARTLSGDWEP